MSTVPTITMRRVSGGTCTFPGCEEPPVAEVGCGAILERACDHHWRQLVGFALLTSEVAA